MHFPNNQCVLLPIVKQLGQLSAQPLPPLDFFKYNMSDFLPNFTADPQNLRSGTFKPVPFGMKKIDKNQLDLFGPQVWYEYLVAISPDEEVMQAVTARKALARQLVGSDIAFLDSKAHITLLNFLHTEHELVVKRVQSVLASQMSFEVGLSGATFFEPSPESKTLYIKVNEKQVIQNLVQKLRDVIGRGKKSNPHLTIAGGLNSQNYKELYTHLDEFKLEASFLCRSVTLLRRISDNHQNKWELDVELPFWDYVKEDRLVKVR
jgi:2'-5' RNA ligase